MFSGHPAHDISEKSFSRLFLQEVENKFIPTGSGKQVYSYRKWKTSVPEIVFTPLDTNKFTTPVIELSNH